MDILARIIFCIIEIDLNGVKSLTPFEDFVNEFLTTIILLWIYKNFSLNMYLKFHRCLMQIIVIMSSEKGSCYYAFMETQRQTP